MKPITDYFHFSALDIRIRWIIKVKNYRFTIDFGE